MELKDKTALVTGASGGIGQAVSIKLLESGANVAMVDISNNLENIVKNVVKQKSKVKPIVADITSEVAVKTLVEDVIETFGKIDILVNCAGVRVDAKSIIDLSDDIWNHVYNVNFKGTLYTCKHAAPGMIKNNYGRIINLSSISGKVVRPYGAPYSCSKAAIIHLTRILALELAQYNVTVNAVCPGPTNTPMVMLAKKPTLEERIQGSLKYFRVGIPNKRLAEPEEIAEVICFLALESTRHITGQPISIDGGESAI